MKTFKFNALITVSAWTEVLAETEEEARAIAEDREPASLCHNALSPDCDEAWHFENDGMAKNITIDA